VWFVIVFLIAVRLNETKVASTTLHSDNNDVGTRREPPAMQYKFLPNANDNNDIDIVVRKDNFAFYYQFNASSSFTQTSCQQDLDMALNEIANRHAQ
jgi:hypothetical protein